MRLVLTVNYRADFAGTNPAFDPPWQAVRRFSVRITADPRDAPEWVLLESRSE